MTDTADLSMLGAPDRVAETRGFFDLGPLAGGALPPPLPPYPTTAMPAVAAPSADPQLPRINPTPAAAAPASPFAFSPLATPGAPAQSGPRPAGNAGGGRRVMSWFLILAVLGGCVYAGVRFGPALVDRARGDVEIDEPQAPLAFPPVVPAAVPPRTANFTVERHSENGTTVAYEVTNDFETGVSRMLVHQAATSDIEVLAVFDVANVRRADDTTWWSIPRGEFPLAGIAEPARLIRTVDQYFPAAMRPFVTIDRSYESVIGAEPMRHLFVTVDSAGLARLATDPVTGQPIPPASVAEFTLPPSITAAPELLEPMTVEMWVDSAGLIRKLIEPVEVSSDVVTVTSLSPEAFNPTFPAPEAVVPLTAEELVDFAV